MKPNDPTSPASVPVGEPTLRRYGPYTGRCGTHTIESHIVITRHTEAGDETFLNQHSVQRDAPITTVLVAEATELEKLCRGLAVGAEAAALRLEEPLRAWALELARRARDVRLLPGE